MLNYSRTTLERWLSGATLILTVSLILICVASFDSAFSEPLKSCANIQTQTPQPNNTETSSKQPAPEAIAHAVEAANKAQEKRIDDALTTLKERASAQQSLIGALATLTGLYAVVLALSAYLRLQQAKEDTKATLDDLRERAERLLLNLDSRLEVTKTEIDAKVDVSKRRLEEFISEVRLDIPAVHGIGRRLENLLSILQTRLPVDGDWTEADTYKRLTEDQREQALVDEMIINSVDIFNMDQDVGNRLTISLLFVSLGQFYLGRVAFLRERAEMAPAKDALCRATLYFNRAVEIDRKNPTALRTLGVCQISAAVWEQIDNHKENPDPNSLSIALGNIQACLELKKTEPGGLFALAWLLRRQDDIEGAIRTLSSLIDLEPEIASKRHRKYIHFSYLNRALYRAIHMEARSPLTPALEDTYVKLILADCRSALNAAVQHMRKESLLLALKKEITESGDLSLLYRRRDDVRSQIDAFLAS